MSVEFKSSLNEIQGQFSSSTLKILTLTVIPLLKKKNPQDKILVALVLLFL